LSTKLIILKLVKIHLDNTLTTSIQHIDQLNPAFWGTHACLYDCAPNSLRLESTLDMENDQAKTCVTTDEANLRSHRLSDSDCGLSEFLYSQLSSISSQPSLTEVSAPVGQYADTVGSAQQPECLPEAASIGPGSSSGSSSIVLHDIRHVEDQTAEGGELEESGSLKAESVLLDPWSDPFGRVQIEDR